MYIFRPFKNIAYGEMIQIIKYRRLTPEHKFLTQRRKGEKLLVHFKLFSREAVLQQKYSFVSHVLLFSLLSERVWVNMKLLF